MILSGQEIQKALKQTKPQQIAVAYVGVDWRSYLTDMNAVEAIVVSPTVGTNPRAIAEMVKEVGWDRVHFLDELHAKIYIGRRRAVVGSANMTANGLSGDRLVEACVAVDDRKEIEQVARIFNDILARAKRRYSTTGKKEEKLSELERQHNLAIANGLMKSDRKKGMDFRDFRLLSSRQFYISWYDSYDDYEYHEDLKAIASEIKDDMHFARGDVVETGKWVLIWKKTASGKPAKRIPSWMFIHDVYKNGVSADDGYDYPVCAIEWKGRVKPPEPFKITREVAEAFQLAIKDPEVAEYLVQPEVYRITDSIKGFPLLLAKMRRYIDKQ